MRIGFCIKWPKLGVLLPPKKGNVCGDEIVVEGLCKYLRTMPGIESAELYAPNHLPPFHLDVMVYCNDNEPSYRWADTNLCYMQNFYNEGSEVALKRLQQRKYDGFAFISEKVYRQHLKEFPHGLLLPFGADTALFRPMPAEAKYAFDVAYVGNDIKGEEASIKYLLPAVDFKFGLFGNWPPPPRLWQLKKWRRLWRKGRRIRPYQRIFARISRGNIANGSLPTLYSSSKIILNCTGQDGLRCGVVTLRTYEVLACRGFLITDLANEELKHAVVVTEGGRDLQEKIKYYLAHPEEREQIAQRGYDYACRNASVAARAEKLLEYVLRISGRAGAQQYAVPSCLTHTRHRA